MAAAPGDPVFPPIGMIIASASATIPVNWLPCDGSAIPPAYPNLITAIGSNNTPNLAGRVLLGAGQPSNAQQSDGSLPNFTGSPFVRGQTSGECTHVLASDEMPSHYHTINGDNFGLHWRSFKGSDDGNDKPFESNAETTLQGTDSAGGGQSHNNMQPYFVVNFYIYAGGASAAE